MYSECLINGSYCFIIVKIISNHHVHLWFSPETRDISVRCVERWKKWDLLPQGTYRLGWQMYGQLTLMLWVRWWTAMEMRKFKQDMNDEDDSSKWTGGNGPPGRGQCEEERQGEEGCTWLIFQGDTPWEKTQGELRSEEWRWWGQWQDKSALEPMLSHLGTFVHEFFPQFCSSLKYHLLLMKPLWLLLFMPGFYFPIRL